MTARLSTSAIPGGLSETTTTPRRCLSVVMPCFNERDTIEAIVARVLASPYTAEIVIVDDRSTDGTREILERFDDPRVRVIFQPENAGKGAALRRGFKEVTADFVIVQDADLEYDPHDYVEVLGPLIAGEADVVFGSRFSLARPHRVLYFWHSVGNKGLTLMSNLFTNLNLTDMETCYKAFRREVIQSIEVEEDRFGFEPEITAKVAKGGWRVWEVGISYAGRTYAEGKKIGWKDAVRASYCVVKYSALADRVKGLADRRSGDLSPATFEVADAELEPTLDSLAGAERYTGMIYSLLVPYLGGRILEVGAGLGDLTELLAKHGQVDATEVSARCLSRLKERFDGSPNVEVHHFDAGESSPPHSYDAIVAVNVLEHLDDDVGVLAKLRDSLLPGGAVAVFVPAFEALYSKFDSKVGHHRRYRARQISDVMRAAGLDPVETRYVNSAGFFAWWLMVKMLGMEPSNGPLVKLYDRGVVPAVRRFEEWREPPFGQSILCVARRAS